MSGLEALSPKPAGGGIQLEAAGPGTQMVPSITTSPSSSLIADQATDHGLLDMPEPWLQPLCESLCDLDLESLFQACTATRDLVLSQCNVELTFTSPILKSEGDKALASLTLACKHASKLNLSLIVTGDADEDIGSEADNLLSGAREARGAGLKAIISVQLQGLVLDALVPSWLTSTCPNMTSLQHLACRFSNLPDPTTPITPACGQLKHLHLDSLPEDITDPTSFAQLQHQMRSLTGLESLSLISHPVPVTWLECCAVIGGQLTQMQLTSFPYPRRVPEQFAAWFPVVQELHLTYTQVNDADLEVLLNCHTLRHLHCNGFDLHRDHTHRACPWTHLTVSSLHVRSFAYLPMAGVQSLQFNAEHGSTFHPCPDLALTTKAAAAITACGGVQWVGRVYGITPIVQNRQLASSACLIATLPLLSLSKSKADAVKFIGFLDMTPELLAVMGGPHMQSPTIEHMVFESCTCRPETLPVFLPSLPLTIPRVVIDTQEEVPFEEEELSVMCVHANRPVVVVLMNATHAWELGWQGRVEAAMAAAGHHHVTLMEDHGDDHW